MRHNIPAGKVAQQLGAFATSVQDPGLGYSTHVRQLLALVPADPGPSLGLHGPLHTCGTQTHTRGHIHTHKVNKNRSFKKDTLLRKKESENR